MSTTNGLSNEEQALRSSIDANERLRARARSVASLVATAAGAMVAGLVFAPSISLPESARVSGAFSVLLLLIGTCAFVAASFGYAIDASVRSRATKILLSLLLFWRITRDDNGSGVNSSARVEDAEKVGSRIRGITDFAACFAGTGVLAFVVTLGFATFDQGKSVAVTLDDPSIAKTACRLYQEPFVVTLSRAELEGDSSNVPLRLPAAACGQPEDSVIFVPRAQISLDLR